jgi:hypothetical protein
MVVHDATKGFLKYLKANPQVRFRIRAERDRTVLYSGHFFRPMWQDIATGPEMAGKQTLEHVLKRPMPVNGYATLADYVKAVLQQIEIREDKRLDEATIQANRDIIWRALSGIFASNAEGKVSFQIGKGVSKQLGPKGQRNVFAATELDVLLRNPHVDATTKDLLAYFKRCIQTKQADINLGFISA